MGCGASGKKADDNAAGSDGKDQAPIESASASTGQETSEDGIALALNDLSKDCMSRVCFDWGSCEFDVVFPSGLDSTSVSDAAWYEFINTVNFELLMPFAEKWRDPSLGASVAQAACKSVAKSTVKNAAKDVVSFVTPLPATLAINAASKVADKVEDSVKTKRRRKEWEEVVIPALTEYLKTCSEKAASNGIPVRIMVGDAKLTPLECAELKAKRAKLKGALAESKFEDMGDAADESKHKAKLRELSNTFHQKAEDAEKQLSDLADHAKTNVEEKLDKAGSGGKKIEDMSRTTVPSLFFMPAGE